jgi:hypothetical protein
MSSAETFRLFVVVLLDNSPPADNDRFFHVLYATRNPELASSYVSRVEEALGEDSALQVHRTSCDVPVRSASDTFLIGAVGFDGEFARVEYMPEVWGATEPWFDRIAMTELNKKEKNHYPWCSRNAVEKRDFLIDQGIGADVCAVSLEVPRDLNEIFGVPQSGQVALRQPTSCPVA